MPPCRKVELIEKQKQPNWCARCILWRFAKLLKTLWDFTKPSALWRSQVYVERHLKVTFKQALMTFWSFENFNTQKLAKPLLSYVSMIQEWRLLFKDRCFDYLFLFSLSCRLLHIHFCLQLFSVCNELDLTFNLSIPFLFLINCVLKKQKFWIRSHKKSVNVLCEIVSPQAGTWVKFRFINSKSPWCLWF